MLAIFKRQSPANFYIKNKTVPEVYTILHYSVFSKSHLSTYAYYGSFQLNTMFRWNSILCHLSFGENSNYLK